MTIADTDNTESHRPSIVSNGSFTQLQHPDWVSMDVCQLSKSLYNSEEQPLNEAARDLKVKALNEAVNNRQYDIFVEYLRSSEGLVDNDLRRKIWPILLGVDTKQESQSTDNTESEVTAKKSSVLSDEGICSLVDSLDNPPHKDEDQVMLDIQRSYVMWTHLQSLLQPNVDSYTNIYSKSDLDRLRKSLASLIIQMLRNYPMLNYYQGYHDIASVVLIVCSHHEGKLDIANDSLAFKVLEKLTISHLRDFMINDINLSVSHLKLIPSILEVADPTFFELIKQTSTMYSMTNFVYYDYNFFQGLSSILTIFSHDITNMRQVLLIWDFFMSYGSISVDLYIYAASLLYFKNDIYLKLAVDLDDDQNFDEVDKDLLHSLVSPSNLYGSITDLDLIKILNKAKELIEQFPYDRSENSERTFDIWFKEYCRNSVLMNTSSLSKPGALEAMGNTLDTNTALDELMKVQEQEITQFQAYAASLSNKIMEQQETLNSSLISDGSQLNLLSSSISSVNSDSSINTKIANTSSMVLKKLMELSKTRSSDKETTREGGSFPSIYKISCTVGIIGFMIHFIFLKDLNYNIFRHLGKLKISGDTLHLFLQEFLRITGGVKHEATLLLQGVFGTVSGLVPSGSGVGQVGLGTMRDSIYGSV